MPPSTDEYIPWNQMRIDDIRHKYTQALISIGINPEGKDLLEVIAGLADELNRTKAELYHFKNEVRKELNK